MSNRLEAVVHSNPFAVVFRPRTLHQQQMRLGYMLVLPSLAVLCFTVFYPIAQTVIYSLYTNRLNLPSLGTPFVGLTNYATLLSQPPFWKAVSHTLEFTSISVAGELALGLLVALTINQNFPAAPRFARRCSFPGPCRALSSVCRGPGCTWCRSAS